MVSQFSSVQTKLLTSVNHNVDHPLIMCEIQSCDKPDEAEFCFVIRLSEDGVGIETNGVR